MVRIKAGTAYMKDDVQLIDLKIPQEYLDRTHEIADQCNVDITKHHATMPKFPVEGYSSDAYLMKLLQEKKRDTTL